MNEVIEERKEKVESFLKKKTFWIIIGVLVLLFLAWHIRTSNVSYLKDVTTGNYTLGPDLDPFLFLRYAEIINTQGHLPTIDTWRYVPLGYKTADETMLLPYMIVYFHKAFSVFSGQGIEYSAVIFPAFMFLLTIIAFFLFIRKVFEENKYKNWIAFVASLFLIVTPSLLPRTVAGIPEKESAGFLFLFLAFYFFLYAWKNDKLKSSLIFGFLAGLSTAIMGLIWGGWIYIFITIAFFAFICFIFNEVNKRRFYVYTLWLLGSIIIPTLFTQRFTIKDLVVSSSSGLSVIVFAILLVDFIIFSTKLKDKLIFEKIRKKIPDRLLSIILAVIIGIILATLLFGVHFIPGFISDSLSHLSQPYTDRLSFTVAENRQPYFSDWKDSFGPTQLGLFGGTTNIPPLVFWLFFAGSIVLFYEVVKNLDKKERIILVILYSIFQIALIFSKYAPNSVFNGANFISDLAYFGSFIIIAIAFIYLFYKCHKEKRTEEFKKLNYSYLFLLAYFIVGVMGARSAIRLIMALAPPVVALAGFLSVYVIAKAREKKEEKKTVYYSIAIAVLLLSAYALYSNYNITLNSALSMRPSAYTQQWQEAMSWVRGNTPVTAVFAHWWDYGYWVQSIGDRATVLDGGNAVPYWDYLMGRHVLTAQNESEALEFLYTHNATYLLIDPTDIGKYGAYSRIGSDANYDRYSWIGTFTLNQQQTQETKNQTVYFYQGGVALDEDYSFNDTNGQTVFLPSGQQGTGVGAFLLAQDQQNNSGSNTSGFEQPVSIFVYNGKQYTLHLRYLYFEGHLYDFKTGYGGCMYIMPGTVQSAQGVGISKINTALFLSERNMRALWVKLYLLNETQNFQLVHAEPDLIVNSVNTQNAASNIGDFLNYNGNILGPVKIWKINYPSDTKANPDYLSMNYPDSVRLDTRTY